MIEREKILNKVAQRIRIVTQRSSSVPPIHKKLGQVNTIQIKYYKDQSGRGTNALNSTTSVNTDVTEEIKKKHNF